MAVRGQPHESDEGAGADCELEGGPFIRTQIHRLNPLETRRRLYRRTVTGPADQRHIGPRFRYFGGAISFRPE